MTVSRVRLKGWRAACSSSSLARAQQQVVVEQAPAVHRAGRHAHALPVLLAEYLVVVVSAQEFSLAGKRRGAAAHEDVTVAVPGQDVAEAGGLRQEGRHDLALGMDVENGHALERHAALGGDDGGDGPAGARHLQVRIEAGGGEPGQGGDQVLAEDAALAVARLEAFDVDEDEVLRLVRTHGNRRRRNVVGAEIIRPEAGCDIVDDGQLHQPQGHRRDQRQRRHHVACPGIRPPAAREEAALGQQHGRQQHKGNQDAPAHEAARQGGIGSAEQLGAVLQVIGDLVEVGRAEEAVDPVIQAEQENGARIHADAGGVERPGRPYAFGNLHGKPDGEDRAILDCQRVKWSLGA